MLWKIKETKKQNKEENLKPCSNMVGDKINSERKTGKKQFTTQELSEDNTARRKGLIGEENKDTASC